MKTMIIDTDTHLTEPADLWTSRLPRSWGDQVMQVRWNEKKQQEYWTVGDRWLTPAWGHCQYGFDQYPRAPKTALDCHPATVNQADRVKVMDETGVRTAVLYPNVAGLNQKHFLKMSDKNVAEAHIRAYNDYQVEYCSAFPGRFIPMLVVPFWNIAETVNEIERLSDCGFGGVVMTGAPQLHGEPYMADPHWDPLWQAALANELSISFHIGNGDLGSAMRADQIALDPPGATLTRSAAFPFLDNGKQVVDLVMSGVLARYPELKFVSVESGVGWIPFVLECMDYHYERSTRGLGNLPWGDLLPSDLFRRQVYANYWFEELRPEHVEALGVEHILFETDFPHPTCLGAKEAAEAIESGLGKWPEEVRERILWKNAADLYNIELSPST